MTQLLKKTIHDLQDTFADAFLRHPCVFQKVRIDKDLHKPHKFLLEDSDRQLIEGEILESILRSTYGGLRLAMILPNLMTDVFSLEVFLAKTPYSDACGVIRKYLRELRSYVKKNRLNVDLEDAEKLDQSTIHLIDYFIQNHEMIEFIPKWQSYLTRYDDELLKTFDKIINHCIVRIKETSLYLMTKEKFLHDINTKKQTLRKSILISAKNIQHEKTIHSWKSKVRNFMIMQYFEGLRLECMEKEALIIESWRNIDQVCSKLTTDSLKKQMDLNDEYEAVQKEVKEEKKDLGKSLKQALNEKTRYLIQLQAIIEKYDTNLLAKYKENLVLTEAFKQAEAEYEQFMVLFREEEKRYKELVVNRIGSEKTTNLAMIEVYRMHKAALKIQRWWRAHQKEERRKRKAIEKMNRRVFGQLSKPKKKFKKSKKH